MPIVFLDARGWLIRQEDGRKEPKSRAVLISTFMGGSARMLTAKTELAYNDWPF